MPGRGNFSSPRKRNGLAQGTISSDPDRSRAELGALAGRGEGAFQVGAVRLTTSYL